MVDQYGTRISLINISPPYAQNGWHDLWGWPKFYWRHSGFGVKEGMDTCPGKKK